MMKSRAEVVFRQILLFPRVLRRRAPRLLALAMTITNKRNITLDRFFHVLDARQKRRLRARLGLQSFEVKQGIHRQSRTCQRNAKPGKHSACDPALPHKVEKLGV